jgi:hypothetical protein
LSDGGPRNYLFFEERGHLAPETIVGWAAIGRLRFEFGWPREHLVVESPTLLEDGHKVLGNGVLDILLLEEPCAELGAKMPLPAARSRVGVEAKETAEKLDKLLAGMRACHADGAPHGKSNHVKCSAIDVLRPRLFLGVAAAGTWRLFTVVDHRGRAVLGDERALSDVPDVLAPDLEVVLRRIPLYLPRRAQPSTDTRATTRCRS